MDGTEHDITNFSTSSSHRLPTISATEVLLNAAKRSKGIPTSLTSLDNELLPTTSSPTCGGIPRGQLTELYGPPGVGKTSLALQLAVNTIQSHDEDTHVLWIDTGSPLIPRRFRALMAGYKLPEDHEPPSSPPVPRTRRQVLEKLSYFSARSLPQLLTLFLHPTALFPQPKTALIVIDDLSNLILGSFPKSSKLKKAAALQNGLADKLARKAANRKWAIVADLASAMAKMAALQGIAIVIVNQTGTSMKSGRKAALKPALSSPGWDAAIYARILLYRDTGPVDSVQHLSRQEARNLRFALVLKRAGKEIATSEPVSFVVERGGLRQLNRRSEQDGLGANGLEENGFEGEDMTLLQDDVPQPLPPSSEPHRPPKRKVDQIADSEDEDSDSSELAWSDLPAQGDPAEGPPDDEEEDDDEPMVSFDGVLDDGAQRTEAQPPR